MKIQWPNGKKSIPGNHSIGLHLCYVVEPGTFPLDLPSSCYYRSGVKCQYCHCRAPSTRVKTKQNQAKKMLFMIRGSDSTGSNY